MPGQYILQQNFQDKQCIIKAACTALFQHECVTDIALIQEFWKNRLDKVSYSRLKNFNLRNCLYTWQLCDFFYLTFINTWFYFFFSNVNTCILYLLNTFKKSSIPTGCTTTTQLQHITYILSCKGYLEQIFDFYFLRNSSCDFTIMWYLV